VSTAATDTLPRADPREPSGRLVAVLLLPLAALLAASAVLLRMHFQPPLVPPYALEGEAPAEVTLHRGMAFELIARPSKPPGGNVGAKAFLLRSGHNLAWNAPYATDADGTIRIGGEVDTVFKDVPAGAWDVALVVGRPEMLPSMPAEAERPRDESTPAPFHVLHRRVVLAED
jgi:hypothetical protein